MSPKHQVLRDRHEGKLSMPWLALLASTQRPRKVRKPRASKRH